MGLKDYDSVEEAVRKELEDLTLDDANQSRAQIALALARTLDTARDATSGAVAQSVPGTAKELRATLDEIRDHIEGGDEFLKGLLSGDDDASVS